MKVHGSLMFGVLPLVLKIPLESPQLEKMTYFSVINAATAVVPKFEIKRIPSV